MVEHGDNRSDLAPGLLSKRDLEAFRDTVHGVRLVCDFGTSKIIGIATWEPDTWSWKITRLETSAENQFRRAAIDLLTDLAAQATDRVLSPTTSLDTVVTIARAVTDPSSVVLKLCNAAVQAVAYHSGLGPIAPALGSLTEQTLAPLVNPPGERTMAAKGMQVLDVTIDAATGQLTPAVHDFAAEEIADIIQDKTQGISQAELNEIDTAIKLGSGRDIPTHEPGLAHRSPPPPEPVRPDPPPAEPVLRPHRSPAPVWRPAPPPEPVRRPLPRPEPPEI